MARKMKGTLFALVSYLLMGDVSKITLSSDIPDHGTDKEQREGDCDQVIDERGVIRCKCIKEGVGDRRRVYIRNPEDRPDGDKIDKK